MRSLSDPSRSTQYHYDDGVVIYADRYYSPHFYCGTNHDDGGVHFIGTVPTKAAYLLAEGGKFNGCTIQAMGKAVMNQIWYRALTQYYSSTETFNGAYYKLLQASSDLYGADSETTRQLRRALQAVELDQAGLCSGLPPRPPEAVDMDGF
ncbi:MAG: M4 family metallopeptidase [Verrucomicrobia bacterium]|nr:M4 family metallopeptidase [Verrucomicrobiota bacterium]